MSACVLWIDTKTAKIFKISNEGIVKKELSHHEVPPIGARHDQYLINAEKHFYHEVALSIGKPDELLVFGAGVAKNHFKNHLETHHHQDLFKALVGVETLDHLTDNQILEASRKFFKKYHEFHFKIG
jgi:hypothetical protein